MYSSSKIVKITGRKNSAPCLNCNKPINGQIAYRHTNATFYEEDGKKYINSHRSNICAKCNYKAEKSLKRTVERYQIAMQGNCSMMKVKEHTWSDGTLTGGKCQDMCTECNLNCAFGDEGSF